MIALRDERLGLLILLSFSMSSLFPVNLFIVIAVAKISISMQHFISNFSWNDFSV